MRWLRHNGRRRVRSGATWGKILVRHEVNLERARYPSGLAAFANCKPALSTTKRLLAATLLGGSSWTVICADVSRIVVSLYRGLPYESFCSHFANRDLPLVFNCAAGKDRTFGGHCTGPLDGWVCRESMNFGRRQLLCRLREIRRQLRDKRQVRAWPRLPEIKRRRRSE
jgi:hypothetical protein